MQTTKLFKSSTFRLALMYMTLFSLSVLILLGFIYWSTAGYMVRQTEATIATELNELTERFDQSGLEGLTSTISERLSHPAKDKSFYLLTDSQFRPIIGNLKQWPEKDIANKDWLSFQIAGEPHQHRALARILPLQGRFYLLVGRDVYSLEKIQDLIREALFWGLMMTIVLALTGGVMMSRTMMNKIEMINDTCHRIMDGDLTQRIPSSGGDDDFDKLVGTLNRMLDQLEVLMQGVKQVTNNIAHDLRTPLSRLRRRLDMLRNNELTSDRHEELLDQAINEADGLLATFKALLRISEVESGSRRVGFKKVDIAALLDDLIELYEPLSEEKGQTLIAQRQQLRELQGDRDLLFQAFANILDNAIKYTPKAGQIRLTVKDQPSQLQVSIEDTGPGIPVDVRDKVFERFFRLEASRSTSGNGLGLSLVAAIINLHHGNIELGDNCPGLNLTVTLPRVF